MTGQDGVEQAALDWATRTGDPAFAEWETFAAWLEADPRHAAAYHAISAEVAEMTEAVAALPAEPTQREGTPRRPDPRRWMAGALAASLVATVGIGAWERRAQPYAVETADGTTRTIALADGSSIALNGGTKLVLDRRDTRLARLERGEALFSVRHDAARPFRVDVGQDRLVDIGTVFDVTHAPGVTRVAVGEGAVIFNPEGEKVRLDAGRALRSGADGVVVSDVAAHSVGGWRSGRLDYDGAPLREVAADVARALGRPITVAPDLAERPFRGTIQLDGITRDPAGLGALVGARMQRAGQGWEIVATP
ncbi:FecR family protein [Sphingomonas jatrophae]|uniref:FecR family protein n=1 Tax=Sphingomonas jatrophae TaxID=1166337 RepID=A0A1I6JXS7_9SPHN|nr:FecR domain-containing protein [Sphingomonas jatrophae]SFR83774.1 FecR family protein [Sphingomonas jatrophae]